VSDAAGYAPALPRATVSVVQVRTKQIVLFVRSKAATQNHTERKSSTMEAPNPSPLPSGATSPLPVRPSLERNAFRIPHAPEIQRMVDAGMLKKDGRTPTEPFTICNYDTHPSLPAFQGNHALNIVHRLPTLADLNKQYGHKRIFDTIGIGSNVALSQTVVATATTHPDLLKSFIAQWLLRGLFIITNDHPSILGNKKQHPPRPLDPVARTLQKESVP
jgi:hypothetical protein